MKKQDKTSVNIAKLREKAEKQQRLNQPKKRLEISEIAMLKLIHELEVHQIELEMQNEDLLIAKETAELAEKKFTELYDFAPSGFLSLSKDGEILKLNFTIAKLLGKDRSNLLKSQFASFITVKTRTIFNNFLAKVFESSLKQTCEIILAKENNLPIHVSVEGVISPNNEFCILTLVDISRRKKSELNLIKEQEKTVFSETKYREIISRVDDAIYSYDPDTFKIIEANEATSKIYGYDTNELIGMSCLTFSKELEKSKKVSTEVLQKGSAFVNIRHHKKKDGTTIFVKLQVHKIFINEKPIIFVVAHDITNTVTYEKELIIAKEKAEESDRLKSAFLANMSHEIRTPMNGILGFAGLLKTIDLNSEKQQDYIRIIEKSGHRMLNTINEIIDISKIESGQMNVSIADVDVNQCLKDSYYFFKPEAQKKNIEIRLTKVLNPNEAIIKTDRDKLNSIFTNLIKNAIKFTNHGSIEFGCGLNSSKTELKFYIKDTGIGIPIHRQAVIFERFIQAEIEDKMAHQGTGLGLTISKAYVEMLEGKLWLESELNVGSTFYFSLPYKSNIDSEIIHAEANTIKQKQLNNLKILIVEDDESSNELLTIMVSDIAKEIISVTTGYDAIEACKNNPDINLVLMDVQLPNMNGYEATMQIREFNKNVIIIAQTAFALTGDREKSIAAGCNDYITKPIKIDILMSLIQKHLS